METAEREYADIKTAELGHSFSVQELKEQSKLICGGVAWPGKGLGFAVVVAKSVFQHFDNSDVYLLDEYESGNMRKLVRQCGVLDFKYKPDVWIGDRLNDAADRFIREMNDEHKSPKNQDEEQHYAIDLFGRQTTYHRQGLNKRRSFNLCSTKMLDMDYPFQYIFPEIKRLLDKERRQLFLKDSKVLDYLGTIRPEEIPEIGFGDFPAIEALAFAVLEIRQRSNNPPVTDAQIKQWGKMYRKRY